MVVTLARCVSLPCALAAADACCDYKCFGPFYFFEGVWDSEAALVILRYPIWFRIFKKVTFRTCTRALPDGLRTPGIAPPPPECLDDLRNTLPLGWTFWTLTDPSDVFSWAPAARTPCWRPHQVPGGPTRSNPMVAQARAGGRAV